MAKQNKPSRFGAFKNIDIDQVIRDNDNSKKNPETKDGVGVGPEKKETVIPVSSKKKTVEKKIEKVPKSSTSISIETPVLELVSMYCKISKTNFSDVVNDLLRDTFIPDNKIKKYVKDHISNM